MTNTIATYAQEILPAMRLLNEKKEALKEWAKEDVTILEFKAQIKEMNENIKAHIEDVESTLVREIKALTTDISEACKAAAQGTQYEPKELKAYFASRAADKVEEVFEKADLFKEIAEELK
jgi:Mg2+ and Co2+ transporter CorA